MKIGFDAKRFFHNSTGLGNYSRDLVRILAENNTKNEYILFNPKKNKNTLIEIDGNKIKEKQFSGWSFTTAFWRFITIKKELIKNKIEIFHGLSGEIPLGLRSTNIKTVVTIHDLIFIRFPTLYSYIDRKIYFFKFKYAARNSNIIVAISEQTKQDIEKFLKIPADKIKVIYQGCANVFKETANENEIKNLREKYNLPQKFILNVGTIEKRKNILSVIKAIVSTDIPMVVVGKKTKYFFEIELFLAQQPTTSQILFIENIPIKDLSVLYQIAEIFVYPSIFEGFGIPIIEALYSKTAVITSTNSCFFEAGGENTIYVQPNDIKNLRKEIVELWQNDLARNLQAEKGFQFVQKFNDKAIALEWEATYQKLLND